MPSERATVLDCIEILLGCNRPQYSLVESLQPSSAARLYETLLPTQLARRVTSLKRASMLKIYFQPTRPFEADYALSVLSV